MSVKNLDDPTSKDFWDYIEKSGRDWREQQPAWSKALEEDQTEDAVPTTTEPGSCGSRGHSTS